RSEVFGFFFSSRRRHTRSYGDWSSDVCSSDLLPLNVDHEPDPTQPNTGSHADLQSGCSRVLTPTEPSEASLAPLLRWPGGKRHRSEERRVGKEWRYRWASKP